MSCFFLEFRDLGLAPVAVPTPAAVWGGVGLLALLFLIRRRSMRV